jgi:hypothetical protein
VLVRVGFYAALQEASTHRGHHFPDIHGDRAEFDYNFV